MESNDTKNKRVKKTISAQMSLADQTVKDKNDEGSTVTSSFTASSKDK